MTVKAAEVCIRPELTAAQIQEAVERAGKVLRQTRKGLGLSTTTVGQALGRTRQWLNDVERGEVEPPLRVLLKLIAYLGLTMDDLYPADPTDPVVRLSRLLRHYPRLAAKNVALLEEISSVYPVCPMHRLPDGAGDDEVRFY